MAQVDFTLCGRGLRQSLLALGFGEEVSAGCFRLGQPHGLETLGIRSASDLGGLRLGVGLRASGFGSGFGGDGELPTLGVSLDLHRLSLGTRRHEQFGLLLLLHGHCQARLHRFLGLGLG